MNAIQYIAFKDELKKIAAGFGTFKTGLNVGQANKPLFTAKAGVGGAKRTKSKGQQPKIK